MGKIRYDDFPDHPLYAPVPFTSPFADAAWEYGQAAEMLKMSEQMGIAGAALDLIGLFTGPIGWFYIAPIGVALGLGSVFGAGLASFTVVQLMLALEEKLGVEFPDRMLNRKSFSSIAAISACLTELTSEKAVA